MINLWLIEWIWYESLCYEPVNLEEFVGSIRKKCNAKIATFHFVL